MPLPNRFLGPLGTILLLLVASATFAQGTRADYDRADELEKLTRNTVFKTKVEPHWFADNRRFWYRNDLADGAREFVLVDATASENHRSRAFDHARLAKLLSEATGKEFHCTHLPMDAIRFTDSVDTLFFPAAGKRWKLALESYELTEDDQPDPTAEQPADKPEGDRPRRGRRRHNGGSSDRTDDSADGRWTTFIKDHNLVLRDKQTDQEFTLSTDGVADDAYESRVYWSPDSTKLVAMKTTKGEERKVYLIESSPQDQLQPKLHSYDYRKPGDRIPQTRPHLFDVAAGSEIPISDELFPNPWSVGHVRWCGSSGSFCFRYNQRGHQVLRIIGVDATTGEARSIIDEQSDTFIDYAFKQFAHHVPHKHEILWMSERDGWNHLYLYDAITPCVKNQITSGQWVVRGLEGVDDEQRQVWFRASGIYPEQDPYYIHYVRVNFDGTGLVLLTEGDGTHSIAYSPDKRFLLDTYSRVDMPPVVELRRTCDGSLVCPLERADAGRLLAAGLSLPERFVAKARDGQTDIHGVIHRPTNFDPQRQYPVIEQIYAGPHGSFVPKSFRPLHAVQSMAELGFIVVQIDGLGTSNRSKAFHDVCWRNLGDSGLPDRILWIQAAAEKYPYMDISRVGIYGGSAGGQSATRALLAHGDFYKVAVSDCGCHDNRMDKIWWNEAWMGWPVGPHYEEQSNVTCAHRLVGKLLLIVGELDRNVDPASTMQLVNALIKADKDFEMLVVPGSGHGIGGAYGVRRRRDFFVRHLLGVQPRWEP